MRQDRAPLAKQGERQEYIGVLSLHSQSLQNKQCFHNLYAYLSAARNKKYGNALQAASAKGYEQLVQMLLEAGVDVNAQRGEHGNALQAALSNGHEKVAQMLLDKGANVNAHGGAFGNALQAT